MSIGEGPKREIRYTLFLRSRYAFECDARSRARATLALWQSGEPRPLVLCRSPVESIRAGESLRPRSIRVVEQHEAPVGPRALREQTRRGVQICPSEVIFGEVAPDLDDLVRSAARHYLRKKKIDVGEQATAVAVPIDTSCDFFEPGVHDHARTTPTPIR